jgi:uncharacterized protein (TIGR02246 family)
MFLVIVLSGCENKVEPLSESKIEAIINEVKNTFELSADAASNHDVETIMKYFWNNEDFVYAGNGDFTKGWSNFYEAVNSVHSNPENQEFRIEFQDVYIKVITSECALVTAAGNLTDFPTEDGPATKKLTVTFLFEKIDGQWVITVGHESGDFSL